MLKRAVSIYSEMVLSLASVSILVACLVFRHLRSMLSENVSYFIDNLGSETRVVVYLDENLTDEQIAAYGEALAQIDNIVKED